MFSFSESVTTRNCKWNMFTAFPRTYYWDGYYVDVDGSAFELLYCLSHISVFIGKDRSSQMFVLTD